MVGGGECDGGGDKGGGSGDDERIKCNLVIFHFPS